LDPDHWFALPRVIRAVGIVPSPPEGLLEPDQAAILVEKYLSELEHGLGSSQFQRTKAALDDMRRFALKRWVDLENGNR